MRNKLYVANINFQASEQDLSNHFNSIGPVKSVKLIYSREEGRQNFHRGFGFVEYENESDATEALNQLNNSELVGRPIKIDFAREDNRGSRPSYNNGSGYQGGRYNDRESNYQRGYDSSDYNRSSGYSSGY